MAMNKRVGKEPADYYKREDSRIRLDSGPYIGKVKNNLDPTRSGRLQVYIPDLGSGDEDTPSNWRTVSYASPYFGSTYQPDTNKQNAFTKVHHSYGMWTVPPDIGNLVLCTFVAGDPNRGYWFACVPAQFGHHMVPGNAGSPFVESGTIEDGTVKQGYSNGKATVVAELNENEDGIDWASFFNSKKPIHEELFKTYLKQGLEEDYIRGIITSSSQRESPSYVFGISTPGRPYKDPAQDPKYAERVKSGEFNEADYAVGSRKGGHTFVMDDGSAFDRDRIIRLRSSSGHQILMNDSERIMYIGNSDGSVWIELTGPGHLNIFGADSINIRAQKDLNFHADGSVNINAGKGFNVSSQSVAIQGSTIGVNSAGDLTLFGGKVGVGSSGSMDLSASGSASYTGGSSLKLNGGTITLNNGSGGTVNRPTAIPLNKLPDTGKNGAKWTSTAGALSSIVPIAPTHEPWELHKNEFSSAPNQAGVPGASVPTSNNSVMSGESPTKEIPIVECKGQSNKPLDPGPAAAAGKGVTNPVNKSYMSRPDAPTVTEGIGPLTPEQTKALLQQTGWSESGCKYNTTNQLNYCGKYQMGAAALAEIGYIKMDAYKLYGGNKAVNIPSSWTGKDGINSKEEFLSNGAVQEKAIVALFKMNYKRLLQIGGIKDGDDICTVAGMLSVAHLLGAGGANNWRKTASGADANGMDGSKYFNRGRYAVDVLATTA